MIQLADYETDQDLKFLKGADEWSLEFHREVNQHFADAMRERGANVVLVTITMKDYFSWLAKFDLENMTENRAQFVSYTPQLVQNSGLSEFCLPTFAISFLVSIGLRLSEI